MAEEHVSIKEHNFARGIDQRAAESEIEEGYAEDLVNVDIVQGRIRKRPGYATYAELPVAIDSLEYRGQQIIASFPSSVNMTSTPNIPLIFAGRVDSSAYGGDFTTAYTEHYYPGASPLITEFIPAGVGVITTGAGTTHNHLTSKLFVGISEKTSTGNNVVWPDQMSLNTTSFDVEIITNLVDAVDAFIFYKEQPAAYQKTVLSTDLRSVVVTSLEHGQDNADVSVDVYLIDTNNLILVMEPNVSVVTSGGVDVGQVVVELPDDGNDYLIKIVSYPYDKIQFFNLTGLTDLSGVTLTLPQAATPYMLYSAYYLDPTDNSKIIKCFPDSVVYDDSTATHTLTFRNSDVASYAVYVFYDYADIVSNTVLVAISESAITGNHVFKNPEIVCYGLLNKDIYLDDSAGLCNHIDTYRRETEGRVISSIGGNAFGVFDKTEVTLPRVFPNMQARTSSELTVGPVFWSSNPGLTSEVVLTADTDGSNALSCTKAAWQSGNIVRYFLKATAHSGASSLSSSHLLSVSQMSHSKLNGTFALAGAPDLSDPNQVIVDVINPSIFTGDYDDNFAGGIAGIYTVALDVVDSTYLFPRDILSGGSLTTLYPEVYELNANTVWVNNISSKITVPAGQLLTATRTSNIFPTRDLYNIPTTDRIVAGDVILEHYRVQHVNTRSDDNSAIATGVVLSVSDSSQFKPGDFVLIKGCCAIEIASIDSPSQITLVSAPAKQGSITLIGKTLLLHTTATLSDDVACPIEVERRCYELTAPSVTGNLLTNLSARYFPATPDLGSLPLRSSMVGDNLYFADGSDPVMKYDGESLYQSGLPAWQPLLFARFITDSTGSFGKSGQIFKTQAYMEADNTNRLTIYYPSTSYTPSDVDNFKVGDYIQVSGTGISSYAYVTKTCVVDATLSGSGTNKLTEEASVSVGSGKRVGYIYLDRTLDSSSYSVDNNLVVSQAVTYKYYYRLNMIDRNNNIIASAATGSADTIMLQSENGKVLHRLIMPPNLGIYDYARMEVQVYRTLANGNVFYRVVSLPLTFNANQPYVEFTDTYSDNSLSVVDPTSVLLGGELGTTFHAPPSAKHITSVSNSLLLANIATAPKLSIVIDTIGTSALSDFNDKELVLQQSSGSKATTTNLSTQGSLSAVLKLTSTLTPSTVFSSIASTSFTLTTTADHNLKAGDWVEVVSAESVYSFATGWWQVASKTAKTFTILCLNAPATPTPATLPSFASATDVSAVKVPVYIDSSAMYGTDYANNSFYSLRLTYRVAQAINSIMRNCPPWLAARAGGEFKPGELYLENIIDKTPFYAYLSTLDSSKYKVFANNLLWSSGITNSVAINYPSRLLVSYPNFPELFDNITAARADSSDSCIDVNPADGQEITGIIPFFGETAFGAALRGAVVVVFKRNSVYLVNTAVKAQGGDPVQKLETNGIGCIAPQSIAVSKNAIFFASDVGIYALRRDLTVELIGKRLERIWEGSVVISDSLSGHHDPIGKKYKVSYTDVNSSNNNNVLCYDHSQEEDGKPGAWTRYDNIPATGWANLDASEFFASTKGSLYQTRRTGTAFDFDDDGSTIVATILLRAMDFGTAGERKHIRHVIGHYRPITSVTSLTLSSAVDMDSTFTLADPLQVTKYPASTNLSDLGNKKLITLATSLPDERCLYLQIQLVDSGLHEGIDFIGLDYLVKKLSHHGIPDAKSSKK